eukprot:6176635-Pleurochrysis_carterae.AAC.1
MTEELKSRKEPLLERAVGLPLWTVCASRGIWPCAACTVQLHGPNVVQLRGYQTVQLRDFPRVSCACVGCEAEPAQADARGAGSLTTTAVMSSWNRPTRRQ